MNKKIRGKEEDLVKKAKSTLIKVKTVPANRVRLAIAWAKNEVTLSQVQVALGRTKQGTSGYVMLARGLKQAIEAKMI